MSASDRASFCTIPFSACFAPGCRSITVCVQLQLQGTIVGLRLLRGFEAVHVDAVDVGMESCLLPSQSLYPGEAFSQGPTCNLVSRPGVPGMDLRLQLRRRAVADVYDPRVVDLDRALPIEGFFTVKEVPGVEIQDCRFDAPVSVRGGVADLGETHGLFEKVENYGRLLKILNGKSPEPEPTKSKLTPSVKETWYWDPEDQ